MTTARRIGPTQIEAADAALSAAYDRAVARGEHLWLVMAVFAISEDTVRRIAAGQDAGALLDGENLRHLAPGCFICEQPLTSTTCHRRCRGEPSP